jgi:transcriptional regulator GlxA family with amidase domain
MTGVGIFLFDDVEVLDFAGPFEVFSTASRLHAKTGDHDLFAVFTISDEARTVRARGGLAVNTQHSFRDHPPIDVLIVPGGNVDAELRRDDVIRWIADTGASTRVTASVCTGALLLAAAGLLDGKRATTHWEDSEQLRRDFPAVRVEAGPRWIDEGEVVTSAGISAGLDMSLHLVRRLAGFEIASMTARQMDFEWTDRGS